MLFDAIRQPKPKKRYNYCRLGLHSHPVCHQCSYSAGLHRLIDPYTVVYTNSASQSPAAIAELLVYQYTTV